MKRRTNNVTRGQVGQIVDQMFAVSVLLVSFFGFVACNSKTETSETTLESLISSGNVDKNSNAAALIKFPAAYLAGNDSDAQISQQLGSTTPKDATAIKLSDTDKKIQFSCPGYAEDPRTGALIGARLLQIENGTETIIEDTRFLFDCADLLMQITGLSPDFRYKVKFISTSFDGKKILHGFSEDFAIIPQQLTALRMVMKEGSGEREPVGSDNTVNVQVVIDPTQESGDNLLKVLGVYVKSTSWNDSYASLAPFKKMGDVVLGWKLPGGASQLADASTVSWARINSFAIEFNQPVNQPPASALTLLKGTLNGPQKLPFNTEPTLTENGTVAIWTLDSPLEVAQYMLVLDSKQLISQSTGSQLDGDWQTGVSDFIVGSGDGMPGGDFNFTFNSLIGDIDGNGIVSLADYVFFTNFQIYTPTTATSYRIDALGRGLIHPINKAPISILGLRQSLFGIDKSELPPVEFGCWSCPYLNTTSSGEPGVYYCAGNVCSDQTGAPFQSRYQVLSTTADANGYCGFTSGGAPGMTSEYRYEYYTSPDLLSCK